MKSAPIFSGKGYIGQMWIDTIRARIPLLDGEFQKVASKANQGFHRFDFEDGTDTEKLRTRLGSYYAGLMIHYNYNHVDIEYSCHKWTKGVNGIAGISPYSRSNYTPLRLALQKIGLKYDESKIEIRRLDIGSLFRLDPLAETHLWSSVSRMHFPKRTATIYPTSITWGTKNTQTYDKVYSKLPEQLRHKDSLPKDPRTNDYLESLKGVIRFEVEFRKKYLSQIDIITLKDLRKNMNQVIMKFAEREDSKVLQLPLAKTKSASVQDMLSSKVGLLKFWQEIMRDGHKFVLEQYKAKNNEGRFYTRIKQLKALNIPFVSFEPIPNADYIEYKLERIA